LSQEVELSRHISDGQQGPNSKSPDINSDWLLSFAFGKSHQRSRHESQKRLCHVNSRAVIGC
jgi:hypothetical protein